MFYSAPRQGQCLGTASVSEVEGRAGFLFFYLFVFILVPPPPGRRYVYGGMEGTLRACVCVFFFSLNKRFISVPSLLFIANKYLSTESLAPRCVAVIHYFCHLAVLSLPPPLRPPPPRVSLQLLPSECCFCALQTLVACSEGAASRWPVPHCRASPALCPAFLCPHLRPQPHKACKGPRGIFFF